MNETVQSQTEAPTIEWDRPRVGLDSDVGTALHSLLINHNPFYLVSAGLMLYGLNVLFRANDGWENPWALLALTGGYAAVLGLTATLIARSGRLWDEARSVLIVLVVLFMAISISLDDLVLDRPDSQFDVLLSAAVFVIAVSEFVLRQGRIRLPLLLRLPVYLVLALFFLYPLLLTALLKQGGDSSGSVYLAIAAFPALCSALLLTALPGAWRGPALTAASGTPWRWPWYPWLLHALLAAGICVRTYCFTVSFFPGRLSENPFGFYFLVPVAIACAVLLLELGLAGMRNDLLAPAMVMPLAGLILALAHPPHATAVYARYLGQYTGVLASPAFCAITLGAVFYAYAMFRRIRCAEACLVATLLVAAFIPVKSVALDGMPELQVWPLVAAAVFETVMAIRRRASWRALAATVALLGAVAVHGHNAGTAGWVDYTVLVHVGLLAALIIGACFHDMLARIIQNLAALGTCLAFATALLAAPSLLGRIPAAPWIMTAYAALFLALPLGYGIWVRNVHFLLAAGLDVLFLTTWSFVWACRAALGGGHPRGTAGVFFGAVSFVVAVAVSAGKYLLRREPGPLLTEAGRWMGRTFPDTSLGRRLARAEGAPIMARPGHFTLIELLVVITLVVILAGLLLPQLGKAREPAMRIGCAANLHSVGQALEMYATDWSFMLVPRYPQGNSTGVPGLGLEALDLPVESLRCPSVPEQRGQYAYCGTIAIADYAPDSGIACDMIGNHSGFANILRADLSHVVPTQDPTRADIRNDCLAMEAGF